MTAVSIARSCNYILKFCFSQLKQTRPATAWFWLSKQTRWPPHIFPRGRRNKQTSVSRVCFFRSSNKLGRPQLVFGCRNKLVGHRTYTGSPKQSKFCQQSLFFRSSNELAGPQFVSGCGCGNKLYRRLPLSQGPLKQTNFCQQSLFFATQTNSPGHSLFLVVGTNSLATAYTPATFLGVAETNKLLSAELFFRSSNRLARPHLVFGCRNKLVGHRKYACHFPRGRRNKQISVSRVCFSAVQTNSPGCRNKLVGHRIYAYRFPRGRRNKQTSVSRVCFSAVQNRLARPQFVFGCRNKTLPHICLPLSQGLPKKEASVSRVWFSRLKQTHPGTVCFGCRNKVVEPEFRS